MPRGAATVERRPHRPPSRTAIAATATPSPPWTLPQSPPPPPQEPVDAAAEPAAAARAAVDATAIAAAAAPITNVDYRRTRVEQAPRRLRTAT